MRGKDGDVLKNVHDLLGDERLRAGAYPRAQDQDDPALSGWTWFRHDEPVS